MAILVDDAIWRWRGERWAHLVSDYSIGELHEFSRALGIRRLSFSGDHYDVTAATRERALGLGAELTSAREIVRRLRAAGLRRRNMGRWQELAPAPVEHLSEHLALHVGPAAVGHVDAVTPQIVAAEPTSEARIAVRGEEIVAAVTTRRESAGRLAEGFELRVTPHDGLWFTEVAADRAAARR